VPVVSVLPEGDGSLALSRWTSRRRAGFWVAFVDQAWQISMERCYLVAAQEAVSFALRKAAAENFGF
jgi:hypothetical protein